MTTSPVTEVWNAAPHPQLAHLPQLPHPLTNKVVTTTIPATIKKTTTTKIGMIRFNCAFVWSFSLFSLSTLSRVNHDNSHIFYIPFFFFLINSFSFFCHCWHVVLFTIILKFSISFQTTQNISADRLVSCPSSASQSRENTANDKARWNDVGKNDNK